MDLHEQNVGSVEKKLHLKLALWKAVSPIQAERSCLASARWKNPLEYKHITLNNSKKLLHLLKVIVYNDGS